MYIAALNKSLVALKDNKTQHDELQKHIGIVDGTIYTYDENHKKQLKREVELAKGITELRNYLGIPVPNS
jgi:iron-sulfur cluster repair protein YtfE (RIC family)